jgi:hypothetical protein
MQRKVGNGLLIFSLGVSKNESSHFQKKTNQVSVRISEWIQTLHEKYLEFSA